MKLTFFAFIIFIPFPFISFSIRLTAYGDDVTVGFINPSVTSFAKRIRVSNILWLFFITTVLKEAVVDYRRTNLVKVE